MRAGELRHVLTFRQAVKTSDGMGGTDKTWVDFVTTRCAVWPISAKEFIRNGQLNHEITHRIRTRYQSGFQPYMRVDFGGRTLEIDSIINVDERGRELDMLCKEI